MPGALAPLGEGFRPLISAVMRGLGAPDDERAVASTVTWLDLLATWNQKIDLTAARSAEELVDLMVADAVVLGRHESHGAAVVDVGSGAGAPGLALGVLRPDLAVTLVEPLGKRVSFLRTVLGHFSAPSVRERTLCVVRGKGEDLAARGETFDTAVARATLPPPAWLELGARMVRPEGAVWVLLAREPAPELNGWIIDADERYTWPLTRVERRALRYRRAPSSAERL
jgi:16S rRNA (guanine527-N7)-methyltransferase